MKVCDYVKCISFPCEDIDTKSYVVPFIQVTPEKIKIFMIKKAPPGNKLEYFYEKGDPFYLQTIKAMNSIWKKQAGRRIIPAGSTYKIRKDKYFIGDKRVFPSYTPTGKNFLIEKAKQRMVAEDIKEALRLV